MELQTVEQTVSKNASSSGLTDSELPAYIMFYSLFETVCSLSYFYLMHVIQ